MGYHYDPIDYFVSNMTISATLTLTNGVALGLMGSSASLKLQNSGNLISQGTPLNLNHLAHYANVQEQSIKLGSGALAPPGTGNSARFRFTDFSMAAATNTPMFQVQMGSGRTLSFQDCLFHGCWFINAVLSGSSYSVTFTNNLFDRCIWQSAVANGVMGGAFYNNLFRGGSFLLQAAAAAGPLPVQDNLFDQTSLVNSQTNNLVCSNNGFTAGTTNLLGGTNNKTNLVADYQVGPLGNYYYPTNGTNLATLINAGSTNAATLGLYHYTVTTNEVVEGTNTVSIGYHYLAVNQYGNPLDSNQDGIPDCLEDANGNGVVDNGEINWALAILTQPVNQTVAQGSNATFSVTVGGITPIQNQWYFNSVSQANAANATLTLNNVQTNNAGNYFVIVTNNFGSFTSSVAALTVVVPPTVSITNPANNAVIIASQTNITLMATASNAVASIVQVQFFQGATSLGIVTNPTYNLVWSNVAAGNYALTAVASNNYGLTATSPVVNITITPLFVTNTMVLWLKGDAITGLTNNAPIGTWLDSSGWGSNATQSTANNQPFYVTNALNGQPVVRFYGTNDFSLPYFLNNTTGAEAFLVIKAATNRPASDQGLWSIGGGYNHWTYYPNTAGEIADCFGSGVSYNYDIGIPAQPLNQYHLYQVSSQTGNWAAWINGSLLYQTTNSTYKYFNDYYRDFWYLGRIADGTSFFAGDIAEILVFSRALSSAERNNIYSYLNCKYALVTNAPAAPANLTATAVSASQISLTWNYSLGTSPTVFTIARKLGVGGVYAPVTNVQDVTSYFDTNLTANTQYYYRVKASNWAGQAGYSNETNATTLASAADMPLSNLLLWLKADGGMGWLATNSVWTWFDQSGNHNDVSRKTTGYLSTMGEQPVYITNAVNGRPAMQFDGTNFSFTMPDILNNTIGAEAFLVIRAATNRPASPQGLWNVGNSIALYYTYYPNINGEIDDCFGSTVNPPYNVGISTQRLDQYHLYDVSSQTGNWAAWVNGQLQYQTTNNAYGYASSDLGRTANGGYGYFYFAGNIAEILVFNRPLTGSEKITVGTYLFSKYNLLANATNSSTPLSPTNLTAIGLAPGQLNLQWARTSTNETAFSIERKSGVSGTYQIVGSTVSGVTNFVDITATPAYTNFYRIRALNYFGNSGYSPEISPPAVSLTNWPGTILANTTNLIGAQAADANGTITNVGFFVGAANREVLLGTDTSAPYTAYWVSGREGPWSLAAMATDSLGNSQFSSAVTVTVYLDSNGDGIPDIFQVQNGNDPLNPWNPPTGDTNSTPPTINLVVPANATLLP